MQELMRITLQAHNPLFAISPWEQYTQLHPKIVVPLLTLEAAKLKASAEDLKQSNPNSSIIHQWAI